MCIRFLALVFLISVVYSFTTVYSSFSQPSMDAEPSKGQKLFKANCSGCHLNGQNLIKKDKPIIGSSKIKTEEIFKAWLENPNPPMPNFKNIALKQEELSALYDYVVSLKGK